MIHIERAPPPPETLLPITRITVSCHVRPAHDKIFATAFTRGYLCVEMAHEVGDGPIITSVVLPKQDAIDFARALTELAGQLT